MPWKYLKGMAGTTRLELAELDNTFYRMPSAAVVEGWYLKTPPGFIFAAKISLVITHDRVPVDCDEDLNHFLKSMSALDDKLGPLLFQFGYFNRSVACPNRGEIKVLTPKVIIAMSNRTQSNFGDSFERGGKCSETASKSEAVHGES